METLPDEVVLSIFRHLPPAYLYVVVPRVSRRWRSVSNPSELPISVEIRLAPFEVSHQMIPKAPKLEFFSRVMVVDRECRSPTKARVAAAHLVVPVVFPLDPPDPSPSALVSRIHDSISHTLGTPTTHIRAAFTIVACRGDVVASASPAQHRTLAAAIRMLDPVGLHVDAAFAELLFASASGSDPLLSSISVLRNEERSSDPVDVTKSIHPLRLCGSVSALHLQGAFAPSFLGAAIEMDKAVAYATNAIRELRYDPVSPRHHAIPYYCPLRLLDLSIPNIFTNLREFGTPWLNPLIAQGGRLYPGIKGHMRPFPSLQRAHFRAELSDNLAAGALTLGKNLAQSFRCLAELCLYINSSLVDQGSPHAPDPVRQAESLKNYALAFPVSRVHIVWERSGSSRISGNPWRGQDTVQKFLTAMEEMLYASGQVSKVTCMVADNGRAVESEAPWQVFTESSERGALASDDVVHISKRSR